LEKQDCLSVEGKPTANVCVSFRSYDLDLGPMTLILDLLFTVSISYLVVSPHQLRHHQVCYTAEIMQSQQDKKVCYR